MLSLACLGTVRAAEGSIAINFLSPAAEPNTLAPEAVTGVPAVAQANWNNLRMNNPDANGYGNRGEWTALVDAEGESVPNLVVRAGYDTTKQSWATGFAGWGFAGNNWILQTGGLHPDPDITISGIPYPAYDLYVYWGCGVNQGTGSATLSVAPGTTGSVDPTGTYFIRFGWFNNTFVPSTATSLETLHNANYIAFRQNTARGFSLVANGRLGGGWSGITGIQIVSVPPPGTLLTIH